jgi:1-acyl-sn-glycerol-3-phosphate acyltransferase
MLVQAIRSLVFYLYFFVHTAILAIIVTISAMITRGQRSNFAWGIGLYWGAANLFILRWIVGIRTRVEGAENIPEGGCIIAAKHMSDWDIYAILPHTKRPAFIAKKELMAIPFFGAAAKSLDTISIDRGKKGDAITGMTDDARAAIKKGCRIIIFPEGTRKPPLADPDYRFGTARLYAALNVPVVPVALNSGLFWPRRSLILWPGTATARFLPAIEPGLTVEEFHKTLSARLERETNALILEAARKGLTRPIPPEMRARLDTLEREADAGDSSGSDTG